MDLFLSYNRADADAVRSVQAALQSLNVRTFADWRDLALGLPWPDALERALRNARAVAVFIGPSGFGLWQKREMQYAVELQVQAERRGNDRAFAVVPVLLRGGDPPAGFLALNTWMDLRDGVSEQALAPLLRMLRGAAAAERPPLDLCPYRDLRAFREEDAGLFFGRDAPAALLVERVDATVHAVDRPRFVAVVGPSGSGKSSVVMAGVLPRLRRPRASPVVWDFAVFTPGDNPWRRLADALMPLLDPELSEARRLADAAALTTALREEGGIASAVTRVIEKSGGSQRLLIVVDQCEELFTLTAEGTARELVRALFAASRSAPFTILLTLRSDYYGKAIALDRDLSDAFPAAQVNLGPVRREELREVVVRPAAAVGLTFEEGLVEQILDDVGDEPGLLPLLEYALTELWKLRSEGRLTFAAYREVGGVSGALARRANALYDALPDPQKLAARRLMLRLVRVSAANEEGSDTRRRARRSELNAQEWAVVESFAGAGARLLVVGTDSASEEEVVEVAHEALIRKWDRLCSWIEEDRAFLVWRQKLALYREAWEAAERDDEALLRGAGLAEAQRWLRTRRAELSPQERELVERSEAKKARSRLGVRLAAAAAIVLLLALLAAVIAPYTTAYNIAVVKQQDVERGAFSGPFAPQNLDALLELDLQARLEALIREEKDPGKRAWAWGEVARALHRRKQSPDAALAEAEKSAMELKSATPWARFEVAKAYFDTGRRERAATLLAHVDTSRDFPLRAASAQEWRRQGQPARAAEVLSDMRRDVSSLPAAQCADAAAAFAEAGDVATARMLLARVEPEMPGAIFVARTYAKIGDVEAAFAALPAEQSVDLQSSLTMVGLTFATRRDVPSVRETVSRMNVPPLRENVLEFLTENLAERGRAADIEQFVTPDPPDPLFACRYCSARGAQVLARHGFLDDALRLARKVPGASEPDVAFVQTYAVLTVALKQAGRHADAAETFRIAKNGWEKLDGAKRAEAGGEWSTAHAAMGDYRSARLIAQAIDSDAERRAALLAILRVYTGSR